MTSCCIILYDKTSCWYAEKNTRCAAARTILEYSIGTRQQTAHSRQQPDQEPGNLNRKPETSTGAGKKKQLSESG